MLDVNPSKSSGGQAIMSGPTQFIQLLSRIGSDEKRWSLIDRHDLGTAAKEVQAHLGESTFAKGIMQGIGDDTNLDIGLLRKIVRFAQLFTRHEAQRLGDITLPNGKPFTWSHVRRLLEVQDPKSRRQLVQQVKTLGWTSEGLAQAIQRQKGGKGNQGGRTPTAPRDLDERVKQEKRLLDEWLNRDRQIWSQPEFSLQGLATGLAGGDETERATSQLFASGGGRGGSDHAYHPTAESETCEAAG